jgi:hypothetical protein
MYSMVVCDALMGKRSRAERRKVESLRKEEGGWRMEDGIDKE